LTFSGLNVGALVGRGWGGGVGAFSGLNASAGEGVGT
jgi:hypothetical protein